MTKDEITSKIAAAEAELNGVRADLVNGPQNDQPSALVTRRRELETELAEWKAMLDEA